MAESDLFFRQLSEIFGHLAPEGIRETIQLVLQSQPNSSSEECLESMINFLVVSGDSALEENNACGVTSSESTLQQKVDSLKPMFPEKDIDFLTRVCEEMKESSFDDIVVQLSLSNNDSAEKDPLDIWTHLKDMLPNADPVYLRNHARVLATRPQAELEDFVQTAIDKNDYPTQQDYLRNKAEMDEVAEYTTNFSVNSYLEKVPNPLEDFSKLDRQAALAGEEVAASDVDFALNFLYNQYCFLRKTDIKRAFSSCNKDLIMCSNKLKKFSKAFRHPRKLDEELPCKNIPLLQEVAFLKHEMQIKQILKLRNEEYRRVFEEAQKYGLLETCGCCFDNQLVPDEVYFCRKDCTFCKECVKTGAEHVIGKGQTSFPCLASCDSEFSYTTLQMVLDKKTFQRLCQRRQMEEVKSANIAGLESCPFCEFSMFPECSKIFKCGNPECMQESCRECRQKSHIPLKCTEIEYDEDVKMRTYIENKMTEALLRECANCSKKFYKESGCNKMTCTCGAKMCYVCGATVADYSHFSPDRCPLYTDNLREFHLNRVLAGAQSAKSELGIDANPNKLKFDPARDLMNNGI